MGDSNGFPMSLIVTGFFVTSLAYLICFCCCIVQFFIRRSRRMSSAVEVLQHQQDGNTAELANQGTQQNNDTLKRKLLSQFRGSLKRFKKKEGNANYPRGTGSCPICFEDYKSNPAEEFIGYIKHCGHYFHFDCVWTWLEMHSTCPLCRNKVLLTEEDIKGLALRHVFEMKLNAKGHGDLQKLEVKRDENLPPADEYVSSGIQQETGNVNPAFSYVDETATPAEETVTSSNNNMSTSGEDLEHDTTTTQEQCSAKDAREETDVTDLAQSTGSQETDVHQTSGDIAAVEKRENSHTDAK